MQPDIAIRPAATQDLPVLRALIDASVRRLQAEDYTPAQMEGALSTVFGVDTQLIADGTYLVVEYCPDPQTQPVIIACGGWSKRKTLYGADQWTDRHDDLLETLPRPRLSADPQSRNSSAQRRVSSHCSYGETSLARRGRKALRLTAHANLRPDFQPGRNVQESIGL